MARHVIGLPDGMTMSSLCQSAAANVIDENLLYELRFALELAGDLMHAHRSPTVERIGRRSR